MPTSSPGSLTTRPFLWPAGVTALLIAQTAVSLKLRQGPTLVAYYEVSYLLLLLLGCAVAIRNAIYGRQAIRIFWSFLAAAYGVWALVPCSWFYNVVLHGKDSAFLLDNPPLFLHIVLIIAAVASRPHLRLPSHRSYRATLNFLLLLFVWVFAYAFLLFPYESGSQVPRVLFRFEGLYLAENLLLLGILFGLIIRSKRPWKTVYWHLFGASALYVCGSFFANVAWAQKDPLTDFSGAGFSSARGLIGLAFTASIFWFAWIGLLGRKLESQLAETIQLDTTDPNYSSVLAMLAVVAIPIVGAWELFRTDEPVQTHEIRLLLVMIAGLLLAIGAFVYEYIANREFTSDVRVAHDRLRLAMGSGKSMGWDWDLKSGQNVWFGDLESTFGIKSEIYLPNEQEFLQRVHPDDRDRVSRAFTDAIQTQKSYATEFRVVQPDGNIRWLTDRGKFYYAGNSVPLRGLGIRVDVTDRKLAEEARQQKEAELKKTEQLAKVGAWQWDPETDTVTWSEELYRIAGINPAAPAPSYKDHPKFYTAASWNRLQHAVEESLRTGKPYKLDLEMVRADGTTLWLTGRGEAKRDDAGRIVQLHGTVQDISERKRAEEAIRESEERFRLVSNTAPVLIWMTDTEKLCTYFNKTWLDFTGRPLSAELGHGWAEGVHAEDLQRCMQTYFQAFDRREEFRMEYRLRARDGNYRWVFDIGIPRFNPNKSFAGYIGSCVDLTERKLAEDALSHVSSRLIEAQEEERARIARDLHDDVNQRLALLCIEIDRLKKDIPDSNGETIGRINKIREYGEEIVTDLQAMSHELHPPRLQYLGIAAAMRGFCEEFAGKQKFEIDFDSHDLPSPVPPDISVCLFRVLQEALHNAAKHSGAQCFDVHLWGTENQIQLRVSDRGVGFDFDAATKGRGLGLISMRERVRLVNGTVSIVSSFMQGTEIHVRVPMRPPSVN